MAAVEKRSSRDRMAETMSEKSADSGKPSDIEIHEKESEKNDENGAADVEAPQQDDYPHGLSLAMLTLSIMLAVFIMSLDTTVIGEFDLLESVRICRVDIPF